MEAKLTQRQKEVLEYVRVSGVVGSGSDGSVLRSLERKGLVTRHFNTAPCAIYYTWTLNNAGR